MADLILFDFVKREVRLVSPDGRSRPVPKVLLLTGTAMPGPRTTPPAGS